MAYIPMAYNIYPYGIYLIFLGFFLFNEVAESVRYLQHEILVQHIGAGIIDIGFGNGATDAVVLVEDVVGDDAHIEQTVFEEFVSQSGVP
jgi:hypothetical protein